MDRATFDRYRGWGGVVVRLLDLDEAVATQDRIRLE